MVSRKTKHNGLIKYSVMLDYDEYDMLRYLAKEEYKTTMANIVRFALRHFFTYTLMSSFAPELKEFLLFVRKKRLERYGRE